MSDLLELACELIRRPSLTPRDEGCQALLSARLARHGFQCTQLPFGAVENLFATHGEGGPLLLFLGHTDVVPPGPESAWRSPPFTPQLRDGRLYGRGAADMKGSVAAMCLALEHFVGQHPQHPGRIALLLTSDEEGVAEHGVRRVAQHFRETAQRVDWCVVGEPSSRERLGDLIRIGRRGSLSGRLLAHGVQGHVAYPELARNPIHQAAAALAELAAMRWDAGNAAFPPTSFQISNLHAGTGADNVIPGTLEALFNFRYGTASTPGELQARLESVLRRHGLDYTLSWRISGEPFLTADGPLRRAVCAELAAQLQLKPELSTGGGTSDGRFIAPLGAEVIELGPVNASIHKVDEHVAVADLERLPALYAGIARRLLLGDARG